jgi:tetratricopeptide (TPR) repeat protein
VAKDGDITWQRYSQQGAARAAAGDHDAALQAFEAARKCLEEVDTKSLDYAKILMNIGVIHAETGRYPVALESYELAKELFVGLKRLKSKNGARLLGNIAVAKSKTAMDSNPNWEEVVSAFTTALQMFQQQGLMRSKEGVRLLIQAGQAKEETGNFADALEDYKAARATLEEAGAIGSKMGIEVLEKMSGWVVIYGGSFFPVLQCT